MHEMLKKIKSVCLIVAQAILMDPQVSQTVSHTRYADITPYTTKDGSIIKELMHPSVHGNVNQSFAEAEVPVGGCTLLHVHEKSEEIYHITAGQGMMSLGGREFQVRECRWDGGEVGEGGWVPL